MTYYITDGLGGITGIISADSLDEALEIYDRKYVGKIGFKDTICLREAVMASNERKEREYL